MQGLIGDLLSSDYVDPGLLDHFWEDYQDLDKHTSLLHMLVRASKGKAKVSKVPGDDNSDDDYSDDDDCDDEDDDGNDDNSDDGD